MNIHQTVPRSDCTSFAKCGKHSLAYCRKYGASECGLCEIVKRKPRNRVMVDGVERKVCSRFYYSASMTGQSIATERCITSRHHGAKCVFRKTIGNGIKGRKTNEYKENKGT